MPTYRQELPHTRLDLSPLLRPPPALSPVRLEYMPLWKKAQGLSPATAGAAADTVVDDESDVGDGGDSVSSRTSSFASASGGDNDALGVGLGGGPAISATAVLGSSGGGLSRSSSRISSSGSRSGSRMRSGGGAVEEEEEEEAALAARARLEELEEELSFEDIIIFRAMAEQQEALRRTDRDPRNSGSDRGGGGNRWGIGGWVREWNEVDMRIAVTFRRSGSVHACTLLLKFAALATVVEPLSSILAPLGRQPTFEWGVLVLTLPTLVGGKLKHSWER